MTARDLEFVKMSAGGNDFIVVDLMAGTTTLPLDPAGDVTRRLCRRALSVGADGLIVLRRSERADVRMIYYNSDGGRAALCGNGVRCAARLAVLRGAARASGMTIETDAGVLPAGVEQDRPWFRLDLGRPRPRRVTLDLPSAPYEPSSEVEGIHVVAGVPHLVVPVPDAHGMSHEDLRRLAPALRSHPALGPEGANVDFITVRDRGTLDIRCWERGVEGETLSSGSGCIASALSAIDGGLVDPPVTCVSRTGLVSKVDLETDATGAVAAILSGDARLIYSGRLHEEALTGFEP